jgi:BirA family biotin operon repressor/biotin-[acetyl-CoA-carboxylase] ligase
MPLAATVVPPGYGLLRFDDIDSTNAEGMRLAAAGETGPLWISARNQTLGRGRSGRAWASVPGNLFASLLVPVHCPPAAAHQISLVSGVAVYDAVRRAANAAEVEISGLRLKWPNDLLVGGAKVAGILPESIGPGESERRIFVIGVGMNLAGHPEGLGRSVTHLAEQGVAIAPDAMLRHLAGSLDMWLERWNGGAGFTAVREAWLERAGPVGEAMTIDTGRGKIDGRYQGIDADGALLVRDPQGQELRFTYGDVLLGEPGQRRTGGS